MFRKRLKKVFLSIAIASAVSFLLSDCALNPYHSSFACQHYYKGQCVSITKAYKESVHNTDGGGDAQAQKQLRQMSINTSGSSNTQVTSIYNQQILDKINKLIAQPKTPIVVPPSTMRVLILPYVNSQNELEMARYVYFFTGKPKWIFSATNEN